MTGSASASETKQRLIDAAGEVFASAGFSSSTVRAICARAGVNIAAVNYHFQDKQTLYLDVLRHACVCTRHDDMPDDNPSLSPERRLRAWVRGSLHRLLDVSRPAWHARLMAREMVEPSPAFDEFITTTIKPRHDRLTALLREIEPRLTPSRARLCTESVVAQVLHYRHAHQAMRRLMPEAVDGAAALDAIADHIADFALGGIARCVPRRSTARPTRTKAPARSTRSRG